jgi:hypothetical protein
MNCPVCWHELPPGWMPDEVVPRHRTDKEDHGYSAELVSGWCPMSGQAVDA